MNASKDKSFPDPLVEDCISAFGEFAGGHPEMWRFYARFFTPANPGGVKLWLAAWSFVRYADDLLDRAKDREEFSKTLEWGLGRVEGIARRTSAPENRREEALAYFFGNADRDAVAIFYDVMRAAEMEKVQVGDVPNDEEIERIIEFNAVRPVLLHCRLHFAPLGVPAEKYERFGRAFGRVTRFADVFVDLGDDLRNGIVPVSAEFLDRSGLSKDDLPAPRGMIAVRRELEREYAVCRRDAAAALAGMGVDRRHRFAYGLILRSFDWCVYGLKAAPGFLCFTARYPGLTALTAMHVFSSIRVAWSERRGRHR